MLPFTKIPFLDAPPIPPKNPRGIDITNAHGHETTKNVSALYSQFVNSPNLRINGGTIANSIAYITTIGV